MLFNIKIQMEMEIPAFAGMTTKNLRRGGSCTGRGCLGLDEGL